MIYVIIDEAPFEIRLALPQCGVELLQSFPAARERLGHSFLRSQRWWTIPHRQTQRAKLSGEKTIVDQTGLIAGHVHRNVRRERIAGFSFLRQLMADDSADSRNFFGQGEVQR